MALVLTRKIGETIIIGDDIYVTIEDIKDGKRIKVSIEAPTEIKVHRLEVYEKIKEEKAHAAKL